MPFWFLSGGSGVNVGALFLVVALLEVDNRLHANLWNVWTSLTHTGAESSCVKIPH